MLAVVGLTGGVVVNGSRAILLAVVLAVLIARVLLRSVACGTAKIYARLLVLSLKKDLAVQNC